MNQLFLFNTLWLEENNIFRPNDPGIFLPETKVSLLNSSSEQQWLQARLVVEWSAEIRIDIELIAPVKLDESQGQWIILDDKPIYLKKAWIGKPRVPKDVLRIGLGSIDYFSSNVALRKHNGDLEIVTFDSHLSGIPLIEAPFNEHPLTLVTGQITLSVDLGNGIIEFGEGSLLTKIASPYQTKYTGVRAVHCTRLQSKKFQVSLTEQESKKQVLQFTPLIDANEDEERLFLNLELDDRLAFIGDSLQPISNITENSDSESNSGNSETEIQSYNGLVPAFEVKNYQLAIQLEQTSVLYCPRLTSLYLVGRSSLDRTEPLCEVICYGTKNEQGESFALYARQVDLSLRIGSPFIRDNTNLSGLVIDKMTVTDLERLPNKIHGIVPGMWGYIKEGVKSLVIAGQPIVEPEKVKKILKRETSLPIFRDGDILPELVCYESLPTLIREVREGVDNKQAEFEMSLKELTPNEENEKVNPLQFRGKTMEWPMLDIDHLRPRNWSLLPSEYIGELNSSNDFDQLKRLEFLHPIVIAGIRDGEDWKTAIATIKKVLLAIQLGDNLLEEDYRNIQSFRYPANRWSEIDASKHCDSADGNFLQGSFFFLEEGNPDTPSNPLQEELIALNERIREDPSNRNLGFVESNRSSHGLKAAMDDSLHTTRIKLKPRENNKQRIFEEIVPVKPPIDFQKDSIRPVLQDHEVGFDFSNIELFVDVNREGIPDNPLPPGNNLTKARADFNQFYPVQNINWFRIPFESDTSKSYRISGLKESLPLLKLETGKTLQTVLEELPPEKIGVYFLFNQLIEGGIDELGVSQEGVIDPDLLQPGWTGLILLKPGFSIDVSGLEQLLSPFLGLRMQYLALTASLKSEAEDPNYSSVYGAFRYSLPQTEKQVLEDETDVSWSLESVDIRFRDLEVRIFEIKGSLLIRKFWRTSIPENEDEDKSKEFKIIGRYEDASAENNSSGKPRIVLEAISKDLIKFQVDLAFIKSALFKSVKISLEGIDSEGNAQAGSKFSFGGEIETDEKWELGPLSISDDKPIIFDKLGLPLLADPSRLKWDWPSIEIPITQKNPINIGFVSFQLKRFGRGDSQVTNGALQIAKKNNVPTGTFSWAGLDVELFKYPALSSNAGKSIGFELILGIDDSGSNSGLWIRGLDFNNLNIELFRFLTISAKKIELFDENGIQGLWLREISLKILGKEIIKSFSAIIFEQDGQRSFVGYIEKPSDFHVLAKIDWLLFANNAYLGDLASYLLTLSGTGNGELLDAIEKQCKAGQLGGQAVAGRWGVGIGFSIIEDGLRAKMLFVDGGSLGLMIESPVLRDYFGIEGLAIAYIKGRTPDEDHFWVEIRVPAVRAELFNFLGGVLAIEVYLNGGFELDVGFPHLIEGFRSWKRGFGFNVGIYVGHAGFYLHYTHRANPNDSRSITVAGGFGLAVGYGKSFDFAGGKVYVEVGIELYGIIEGIIVIVSKPGSLAFNSADLKGIVGIRVYGYGEIDVWILYTRVEVEAFGESESRLLWTRNQSSLLQYSFRFGQRFRGKCRVGKGIFSYTFSVEVQATMSFKGSINI